MLVLPQIKIRMALRRLQKQPGEQVMQDYLFPIMAEMVGDIRSKTKWSDVAESYSLEDYASYNRQYYRVYNTSDLWAIEELGQKPHIIPQPPHVMPSDKLYAWMDENQIPPVVVTNSGREVNVHDYIQFVLHRPPQGWWVTHHPGTVGDHIAHETFEQYKPRIQEAAHAAIQRMMEPVDYVEYGGY